MEKKETKNKGYYRIILMRVINIDQGEVKIIDKIKVNIKDIKTVKGLKYYIIDNYKKQKFCPCMLTISIPFEDGFLCSEINDTPNKSLEGCFSNEDIFITIDFKKKCDCGFIELEKLTKREIYEMYDKIIKDLKKLLEYEKNDKYSKIKDLEEINNDILNNYDKQIERNYYKSTQTSKRNEEMYNIIKINENNSFLNQNFVDFYDVIIDIKSIKDLNIGWEIKMNENGESRFKEYKEKKALIIGVIGNSNRGKSFLLSKISKINLPTGTSIRTEGLSIKYPELEKYKNRKIILLDSAGLETPLLLEKDSIKNIEDSKDFNELLKEKAREKLMTELFLQYFIINNSNILITVVGILTYSEQKLLNRIREEMSKKSKTLYIIHNLMTFTRIEQVKQYIKDYLLKDATFDLEERTEINTKIKGGKSVPYFYEKRNESKIFHLIYANEGSEAGNFYNEFALNFFENSYQTITDIDKFDVIQKLKSSFLLLSNDLLEKNDNNIYINEDDFLSNEIILKEKIFKLKYKKDIILKRCYIDELGFQNLRRNGFNPCYNCYEIGNKLVIRIEVPGNMKIKSNIKYEDKFTNIIVEGNKKIDNEPLDLKDNIINSREFGKFNFTIPLIKNLSNKEPIIKHKLGVTIIEYELAEKNKIVFYYEPKNNDEI